MSVCFIDSDGRVACTETEENPLNHNPDDLPTLTATFHGGPTMAASADTGPVLAARADMVDFDGLAQSAEPLPEGCCVHVSTDTLDGISPSSPAPGRVDCPQFPDVDGAEVAVLGVSGDGEGGMLAIFTAVVNPEAAATTSGSSRTLFLAPICTAGPQDDEPVRCCIGDDRRVLCFTEAGRPDPSHELNGIDADEAVARGITLQLCDQPPPEIEGCCFELIGAPDQNGRAQARIVCDDPERTNSLEGTEVTVTVSPDGTEASYQLTDLFSVELPICVTTDIPEEIPCCVEDGILICRDEDGSVVSELDGRRVDELGDMGLRIDRCPEETVPDEPPTLDCCVKALPDGGMILVCAPGVDANGDPIESPYNGYELMPGEFQISEDGTEVQVQFRGESTRQPTVFLFPMCPVEQAPPDLCYDVAAGVVRSSSADFDGRAPQLIDLVSQGPDGPMFALIDLEGLGNGSGPVQVPVCPEEPVPEDCCFQPNGDGSGTGIIVCRDGLGVATSAFDGQPAVLVDINQLEMGLPLVTVSYEGGTARMPICREPKPDDFFCCVNLDTETYVCPGDPSRDGQPVRILEVFEHLGKPFVRVDSGRAVPACGVSCPPPVVCPECPPPGECPEPPPCPDCPPGEERVVEKVVYRDRPGEERVVEKVVYRDRPCGVTPQTGFPCTPSTLGSSGIPAVMGAGQSSNGAGIRTSAQAYQEWKAQYERPGIGVSDAGGGPMTTGGRG